MTSTAILEHARAVLRTEAVGLTRTAEKIGDSFAEALNLLVEMKGKVVTSGVGKSGIVARKVAATLNSTGTPSTWLAPTDALHGDIGLVQPGDVALLFSKSGTSDELAGLMSSLSTRSVATVLMTGRPTGLLQSRADVVLEIADASEACPYELAPTTSIVSMIGLADALALCLMRLRGFKPTDFARNHPSGALGRRLTMRVDELMTLGDEIPRVESHATFADVVLEISKKRLGATVVEEEGVLVGVITDGDLRRTFEGGHNLSELRASDFMSTDPMTTPPGTAAAEALSMLERTKRTHLPVTRKGTVIGFLHLHHLVEAGL